MLSGNGPTGRLPETLRVACFDFSVELWGLEESYAHKAFGHCDNSNQTIRICKALSPVKLVDTLMHELGHAIYWAYGMEDSDAEERVVATFATAWTQVFRDNPALLNLIQMQLTEGG